MEGPGRERQHERLAPSFERLTAAFEAGRLRVADVPNALEPELILMIEIAGEVEDFIKAVRRIENLEWLLAQTDDQLDPDDDFAVISATGERKAYGRQLFVLASDAVAWHQLLRLWEIHRDGRTFPRGFTKFRDLFDQLRALRPWGDGDRLDRAGAADVWRRDLADLGDELVPFETELWLRKDPDLRAALRETYAAELRAAGGQILQELVLEEISYHGLLGQVPARLLVDAAARGEVRWMSTGNVRLFHPAGQVVSPLPDDFELSGPPDRQPAGLPQDVPPRVAILDGLPVENHELLAGRLIIDDPEGWAAAIPAGRRIHGTAMASLALHGDLSVPELPPREPVYVRPILRYEAPAWVVRAREQIPADRLVVDVIHSAVVRMLEGDDAVAPSVCVITLSVGDVSQQFDRFVSPWARLLDWLAFEYQVLFLVSAGNHIGPLRIRGDADIADAEAVERETLEYVRREALSRRLLAPAEAINVLTVGAEHADGSGGHAADGRLDPYSTSGLPSVISPTASGVRRSIKPEILMAGGRQLVRPSPPSPEPERVLEIAETSRSPGLQVAAGCGGVCARSHSVFVRYKWRERDGGARRVDDPRTAGCSTGGLGRTVPRPSIRLGPRVKALLVHTARWGDARDAITSVLSAAGQPSGRAAIARFLGYGCARPQHALMIGSDTRITALYAAEILDDDVHRFSFPLPPSLAGSTIERRLTFTLAALTPVNAGHRSYRRAAVWVDPGNPSQVFGARDEADSNATRRGTLQHETLAGRRAVPYVDGDTAEFEIACRADAGALNDSIPYAFVVTLEVPVQSRLPIYTELRDRLAVRVPVRPQR